jgi:hypothetical protein
MVTMPNNYSDQTFENVSLLSKKTNDLASFARCRFSAVNARRSSQIYKKAKFQDCRFVGVLDHPPDSSEGYSSECCSIDFSGIFLSKVILTGAKFSRCKFHDIEGDELFSLSGALFEQCVITGVNVHIKLLGPYEQAFTWWAFWRSQYLGVKWSIDIRGAKFTGDTFLEGVPGETVLRDSDGSILLDNVKARDSTDDVQKKLKSAQLAKQLKRVTPWGVWDYQVIVNTGQSSAERRLIDKDFDVLCKHGLAARETPRCLMR